MVLESAGRLMEMKVVMRCSDHLASTVDSQYIEIVYSMGVAAWFFYRTFVHDTALLLLVVSTVI
jgi:hypothetical protein